MIAYLDELMACNDDNHGAVKSSSGVSSVARSSSSSTANTILEASSSSSSSKRAGHSNNNGNGVGNYRSIVAFKPTGWCGSTPYTQVQHHARYGTLILHHVPYSEHSTFEELTQFMNVINHNRYHHHHAAIHRHPSQIISTVHTAPSTARQTIALLTDALQQPSIPHG
jgi:hypothetical protein